MIKMNKIRKYFKTKDLSPDYWTYEEDNKYYLMCNDSMIAIFGNLHSIELFERDFIEKDKD